MQKTPRNKIFAARRTITNTLLSSLIQTILSVPEFTRSDVTGSATYVGRGLYRRWGITPRPEETILKLWTLYPYFAWFSRGIFVAIVFSRYMLLALEQRKSEDQRTL